jgi:hypothetical protein
MKTLIVHPQDASTSFLYGVYKDLPDKTVITGGLTKNQLQKEILRHDRILLSGHGSPQGLLSVGKFSRSGLYIIDDTMVQSLKNKANTLCIWCNADVFVRRHGLSGFNSGMFLSQMSECLFFRIECTEEDIIESNQRFAELVGEHINEPPIVFYKNVLLEYGRLEHRNPVARYNHTRLFLNHYQPDLFLPQVVQNC